jgi:carbonic anhydrase
MIQAQEALQLLREGNERFVSDQLSRCILTDDAKRIELVAGQEPFAIILGCSDSRVPAEIVFDQCLGDLFVIRVAGNIVGPSVTGSVEFAAEALGTRLVVVLGHSKCGLVSATLDDMEHPGTVRSPSVRSIEERVWPTIRTLKVANPDLDREALLELAVRANVHASVHQLRQDSPILDNLIVNDGLVIVGAEYSLDTGVVTFFDA